jgi:hypothetical protein
MIATTKISNPLLLLPIIVMILMANLAIVEVISFTPQQQHQQQQQQQVRNEVQHFSDSQNIIDDSPLNTINHRRGLLNSITALVISGTVIHPILVSNAITDVNTNNIQKDIPPKFIQQYPDFISSNEGWSYKVVTPGKDTNIKAMNGDRIVFEWSGYTIGYYGRPFQAKGGPQGGAFDKELDYERTVIGSGKMVKGLESALVGTSPGQILQIVVPYEMGLSYPEDDPEHVRVGPKPSTFSGQRALNFVLQNPRVDRTLLFNVKVVRIDKPNLTGGFSRG